MDLMLLFRAKEGRRFPLRIEARPGVIKMGESPERLQSKL